MLFLVRSALHENDGLLVPDGERRVTPKLGHVWEALKAFLRIPKNAYDELYRLSPIWSLLWVRKIRRSPKPEQFACVACVRWCTRNDAGWCNAKCVPGIYTVFRRKYIGWMCVYCVAYYCSQGFHVSLHLGHSRKIQTTCTCYSFETLVRLRLTNLMLVFRYAVGRTVSDGECLRKSHQEYLMASTVESPSACNYQYHSGHVR